MSDDLVKRLKNPRPMSMFLTRADQASDWTELLKVAADRIEELEAKLAKVTAAYRIEAMRRDDYSHAAFDQHIAELKGQGDD